MGRGVVGLAFYDLGQALRDQVPLSEFAQPQNPHQAIGCHDHLVNGLTLLGIGDSLLGEPAEPGDSQVLERIARVAEPLEHLVASESNAARVA